MADFSVLVSWGLYISGSWFMSSFQAIIPSQLVMKLNSHFKQSCVLFPYLRSVSLIKNTLVFCLFVIFWFCLFVFCLAGPNIDELFRDKRIERVIYKSVQENRERDVDHTHNLPSLCSLVAEFSPSIHVISV